jgi:hypothetical protein
MIRVDANNNIARVFLFLGIQLLAFAGGSLIEKAPHRNISSEVNSFLSNIREYRHVQGRDRWQDFRGVGLNDRREYVFDESSFRWKTR